MSWLAGSVYNTTWEKVELAAYWLFPVALASLVLTRELDVLTLGDETATGLGQGVSRTRCMAIGVCALLAAISVAGSGPIGFVGLIAPHLARRIVGHNHLPLLPMAALVGALVVVSADLAGRSLMPPVQLPVGLVTPLVGAPLTAVFAGLRTRRAFQRPL